VRRLSVRWAFALAVLKAPLRLLRAAPVTAASEAAADARDARFERLRARKQTAGQRLDERGPGGGAQVREQHPPAPAPAAKAAGPSPPPTAARAPASPPPSPPASPPAAPTSTPPPAQGERLSRLLDAKKRSRNL